MSKICCRGKLDRVCDGVLDRVGDCEGVPETEADSEEVADWDPLCEPDRDPVKDGVADTLAVAD